MLNKNVRAEYVFNDSEDRKRGTKIGIDIEKGIECLDKGGADLSFEYSPVSLDEGGTGPEYKIW